MVTSQVVRSAALALAASLAAGTILTPLARRTARLLGVVDHPDGVRKLQQQPTALLGGLAVYVSLVIGFLAAGPMPHSGSLLAVALGLGLLCGVGVCDDVCALRAGVKFLAQLLAMLPIVYSGYSIDSIGVFGAELDLGSFGPLLSLFWLAACINAINLIDGVDGLASVAGACIALAAGLLALAGPTPAAVVGAAALVGALSGFLLYNRPPASIYLGDAGSMMIGAALGLLTMRSAAGVVDCTSLPLMVILMAVPLGDTCLAILRRWLSGHGIWCADRGHIHHRLMERGFRVPQLLAIVGGVCLLTGAIALLTRHVELEGFGLIAMVALAALLVNARLMGHYEWRLLRRYIEHGRHVKPLLLPAADQLPGMTFEAAWQALSKAAAQLHLAEMQVVVSDSTGGERRHRWTLAHAGPRAALPATVELRFDTPGGGACRVLLSAPSALGALQQWPQFLGAAWTMGQHWANQPARVPGDGPRLFVEQPSLEERRAA